VLGWGFDLGKLRAHANKHSDWQLGVWWEWSIRLVAPAILAALFIWTRSSVLFGLSRIYRSHFQTPYTSRKARYKKC